MLAPRIAPPPVEWLDIFLRSSHRRQYPAKTTIIHAGDVPETLYYVVEGSVSVVIEDDDGREIVLAYLCAGDFFGEMGLFNESHGRSAWVIARSKCELAEINYDQFRRLSAESPDLLLAVTSQISERLPTLLELAKLPDAITHPDGMQIRITRQEIARIVGCSREMVGRVLKELEDRGLIHARGKTMVIYGTR